MNTFLLLLLICIGTQAILLKCLDSCLCDIKEQSVVCYNTNRTSLFLPLQPFNGIRKISLSYNQITQLPNEIDILNKFPDIETIVLRENPHFNCSQLPEFREINIVADCEVPQLRWNDTEDCDQICKQRKELLQCFKDCECDKNNSVVHCQDRRSKKFILPLTPLPDYQIILLTNNSFVELPNEHELRRAFPEIRVIKITTPPAFDCDLMPKYKNILIVSKCSDGTLRNFNHLDEPDQKVWSLVQAYSRHAIRYEPGSSF